MGFCCILRYLKFNEILFYSCVDPDGDVVAFSTDEELMEALGYVVDGIFKVFITLKGKCFSVFKG